MRHAWAIDFDGTLAHYDGWKGQLVLGEPILDMVKRVKGFLAKRDEVFIFTARINNNEDYADAGTEATVAAIKAWCVTHIGRELPVVAKADFHYLFDDRAIQVVKNTGMTLRESVLALVDDELAFARGECAMAAVVSLEALKKNIQKLCDQ